MNALLLRLFAIPFGSNWLHMTLRILLYAIFFFRAITIVLSYSKRGWVALAKALMSTLAPVATMYLGAIMEGVLVFRALIFAAALVHSVRSYWRAMISRSNSGAILHSTRRFNLGHNRSRGFAPVALAVM